MSAFTSSSEPGRGSWRCTITNWRDWIHLLRPSDVWEAEPAFGGWYTDREIRAVSDCLQESLLWTVGFRAHREVQAFEQAFASYVGAKHAVALNSCGTALDLALKCLDIQPGDEVVSPAINFPGTHLAILGSGANLILCEADPTSLNVDVQDMIRRLSPRTRAVVITHMNGLSADMDAIEQAMGSYISAEHGAPKVIYDAARSCGATYRGRHVGASGWLTAFSFQYRKLMTTLGEGGMITTSDDDLCDRLRRLRSFGCGVDWGSSYKMTKPQAVVGLIQLNRLDEMIARRVVRANERTALLSEVKDLSLPIADETYGHVYYLYSIMLPPTLSAIDRDRMMLQLREEYRIGCAVANPPTYCLNRLIARHTMGQHVPVSDGIGGRLICPVLHPLMSTEENAYVASAVAEVYERVAGANHLKSSC